MGSTDQVEAILDQLRASGGRVTSPRRAIVEALVEHPDHPTADQLLTAVQARQPDVHESTVYRVLDDLRRLGAVDHVHLGHGAAVYHLAEESHHHLVCQTCGRVIEVPDRDLERLRTQLRETYDFEIEPQHFALLGRCTACAAPDSD